MARLLDRGLGAATRGVAIDEQVPWPTATWTTWFFGRLALRMTGWSVTGELPRTSKFVLIAAPHVSRWDIPYFLGTTGAYRLRLSWFGKRSLFEPPLRGWLLRRFGGVPIDRDAETGLVDQAIEAFSSRDAFCLGLAPSGTKARDQQWRSGFYHIASGAGVPVVCAFVDFATRRSGILATVELTGDVDADMATIRALYRDVRLDGSRWSERAVLAEESRPGV